jgi:Transposase
MRQEIAETKAKWRALVSEQAESGLSVAAFCNQRGLRAWQFYEWKKRVRKSETARFVEVQAAAPAEPERSAGERSQPIEVRLRTGRSLIVRPGFNVDHLRALLTVLESEA